MGAMLALARGIPPASLVDLVSGPPAHRSRSRPGAHSSRKFLTIAGWCVGDERIHEAPGHLGYLIDSPAERRRIGP